MRFLVGTPPEMWSNDGSDAHSPADKYNSNAATFHRVRNFRDLVNRDFIEWETE